MFDFWNVVLDVVFNFNTGQKWACKNQLEIFGKLARYRQNLSFECSHFVSLYKFPLKSQSEFTNTFSPSVYFLTSHECQIFKDNFEFLSNERD